MIEIKNLYKKYNIGKEELTVLNNVNLNIKDGEFIAILGQSGSGKSTLLNMIGGLDSPNKGSIIIDGKNISNLKDNAVSKFRNEKIGFVFQAFNLEPSLTVLENVMMPLMFCSIPERKRKEIAKEALEFAGLEDILSYKAAELSVVQSRSVSIARAFVNNPKIILADEPTGNLDSKTGKKILEILKKSTDKGYTVIMVTHNREQAIKADRIIRIHDGMILEG